MNHPSAAEWMAYLYDEIGPAQKQNLHDHLAQCAACGEQLNHWRAGTRALDDWKLPEFCRAKVHTSLVTILKRAAAAVIVLSVGFALGRQTSSAAGEVATLKVSVAQLAGQIQSERSHIVSNAVAVASMAATGEMLRLLSDYAKLDDARRTDDGRTVGLAMREMDSRIAKLRTELETVAINTASGFRQTKAGLTTLASYTVADRNETSDLPKAENKNQ